MLFLGLAVVGLLLVQILAVANAQGQQVPCFFIFGDSLVDAGNNNGLMSGAKANYKPYGVDFPGGVSTGRFTNGLTIADFIGQHLGFQNFIPPFASATDQELSTGVNYGSGSAGILPETGKHVGGRICLEQQVRQHEEVLQRCKAFTPDQLSKCFYMVYMGNNDFINNYFLYPQSRMHPPDMFANILANKLSTQLQRLYQLGARKIGVFGLRLVGCPSPNPCPNPIHIAIGAFNSKLQPLVDQLNSNLAGAKFTFINLAHISIPLEGLSTPKFPCCQVHAAGMCIPNSIPCANRASTTLFDGMHSSEVANKFLATGAFNAKSPDHAVPCDIARLVQS